MKAVVGTGNLRKAQYDAKASYKAQRARDKAALRQLPQELNIVEEVIGSARTILITAEAAEAVKDYNQAKLLY